MSRLAHWVARGGLCLVVVLLAAGCSGPGPNNDNNDDNNNDNNNDDNNDDNNNQEDLGFVYGRLAQAGQTTGQASSGLTVERRTTTPGLGILGPLLGHLRQPVSLDQVSVDLAQRPENDGSPPDSWPVMQTATPDADGAFVFENLPQGDYSLRLNQPEFADLAYRVDSTEFHLDAGQVITLVLPLVTTIAHNLMDPNTPWSQMDLPPAAALDADTGEIALVSNLGFAVIDPGRATMDLLSSRNIFLGRQENDDSQLTGWRVVALAPKTGIAWILYPDRLVRIDRSLFTDPDSNEVIDLDQLAIRASLGDRVQTRLLPPQQNENLRPRWSGEVYFSPDESILYACSQNAGVFVFDLGKMEIARVILGQALGYNPASNHLFFTNGDYGQHNGTDLLVVDASTFLEVSSVPLRNVFGVAAVPDSTETIVIRGQQSTADVVVPFVVVVDGTGAIATDERARDYLGVESDPDVGAPSFDLAGVYFMIGSNAFRIIGDGTFEPVQVNVPMGQSFQQQMMCVNRRAVDPANLFQIWYGNQCGLDNTVGLFSLDGTSIPVAVRPGVPVHDVLLDRARGRAIFGGFDRLVLIHYADPDAAGSDELVDLTAVVAPFTASGATCSSNIACDVDELCAGMTDTAYTGRCVPNPRLPYRPFCGGFSQAACDEDMDCTLVNPTNPNSVGRCQGYPNRDYAVHGPLCNPDLSCPTGMTCGSGGRCEPKTCLFDEDCAAFAGEICGLVAKIGRVCLTPGPLADGAPCFDAAECQHGACVGLIGPRGMGDTEILHADRGLAACTSPCYSNADCHSGGQCFVGEVLQMDWLQNSAEVVWQIHSEQVMPYCRPPNLPALEECISCATEELCTNRFVSEPMCQFGFDPSVAIETNPWKWLCLPPSVDCQVSGSCPDGMHTDYQCKYPCSRSSDCTVFPATCLSGTCSIGSPCEAGCAPEESCGRLDSDHGFCAPNDSCASDADCSGPGSCIFGLCLDSLTHCEDGNDCQPGEECVNWWWDGSAHHCLPAICGCASADMLCDPATDTCIQHCASAADCAAGEECVGGFENGFYCGPPQCGCTGPEASMAVCDIFMGRGGTCSITQMCTDLPCDGSVNAECVPTPPDPLPGECRCPGCDWNTACSVSVPVSLCPSGYSCTNPDGSFPNHVGNRCLCDSPECQTP